MVKKLLLSLTGFLGIFILGFLIFMSFANSASGYITNSSSKTDLHFDNNSVKIDFDGNNILAKLPLINPKGKTIDGTLLVSVLDPNDNQVATNHKDVKLTGKTLNNFDIKIPTDTAKHILMSYRLAYTFKYHKSSETCGPNKICPPKYATVVGIKSIYSCFKHLSVRVLAQSQFISGAPASLRLVALNPSNNAPITDAQVLISMENDSNKEKTSLFMGKTNKDGTVNANFQIPEEKEGNYNLKVELAANLPQKALEVISQPIKIKRDYKIMLSTDKPIYQPNQTMKIRALALNAGTLKPVNLKESILEVYDAKGNKVFKKKIKTNEFGIISSDFTLADEVNMGNYKIKAIVDNINSEKTVKVSRYVLPKYKVVFDTEKEYYLPSEMVKGTLDVNYFFGKSVNNAEVKIKVDKFDIGFSRIEDIEGYTDQDGHFDFEFKLPDKFVGQKISGGNAFVKFDIQVKDTADHIEKKTASVMVADQAINIVAIPESGTLAKGLDNTIYIMTTYPDGSPATTSIDLSYNNKIASLKTDSAGIATFNAKPENDKMTVDVNVVDFKGNKAQNTFVIKSNSDEQSVLLRTDKAIAKVGETLKLQAISTKSKGTVYIDMIKNGQTVLTKSMDLKSGKAEMAFDMSSELVGTLGINAYIIDKSSEIIRDSKIVYVNPAKDLVIAIKPDSNIYKPAQEAVINFKVTDSNQHPILAALGVYVVDESVFALSELQPGLEKVFFTLEEEILKPRYEIHGLTPGKIVEPVEKDKILEENQQKAAKVLFAAAEELKDYSVNVNTYKDSIDNLIKQYYTLLYNNVNTIKNGLIKYNRKNKEQLKYSTGIQVLIDKGYIKESDLIDPWGNEFAIIPSKTGYYNHYDTIFVSKGPDGLAGTPDDVAITNYDGIITAVNLINPSLLKIAFDNPKKAFESISKVIYTDYRVRRRLGRGMVLFEENEMMMADGLAGNAVKAAAPMAAPVLKSKKAETKQDVSASSKDQQEVRVREYFPETLYANAAIITDENGNASITIPMADSITTWRMSAMGNSLNGLLGSTTHGIKVFQDFFIDIDLPVALTEKDKVSIPIAIYNYLPTKQTIKLKMNQEKWYSALDGFERSVTLESNQVSVEYFTIQVDKIGNHTLTVYAYGDKLSDAIKRKVRVEPDGEEFRDAINGRLDGKLTQTVKIPSKAIDDASRILVKVYPGYLSQVIEGLDKIFRMPSGCFEQTSSTTYPNVLVLDYLKRTNQLTPEIQMKAESYINSGYQRLLTFEVNGGGFDWFGSPPANKILTAYGLMEFYDMSAVHEVDPNLINRTQNWLINKQEADGSWKPNEGGIAEGAINQYKGDTLRTTAYIGWSLASSGYTGSALDKALAYIKNNLKNANDPYTYAVIANLFVLIEPESFDTKKVFDSLIKLKKEENDYIYWEQKNDTPMYGAGKSANIEVTALATIALINYGKEIGITNKALNYLVKSKDSFGTWQTTQATILSMKALLMSMSDDTSKVNATVSVFVDGEKVGSYNVNDDNYDVVKQFDLKKYTKEGDNNITLAIDGEGSLLYQVVSIYYIPWDLLPVPKRELLSIGIDYDKTTLDKNEFATAEVTVVNNSDKTANMVIVDLGIPPGFEVQTEDLDNMVKNKVITKYSIAARQVILYFEKINANETVEFKYRVKAKISIKAKSGKSKVYKYYEPEVNSTAEPVEITVN